jgi:hypothetical protein
MPPSSDFNNTLYTFTIKAGKRIRRFKGSVIQLQRVSQTPSMTWFMDTEGVKTFPLKESVNGGQMNDLVIEKKYITFSSPSPMMR